MPNPNIRPPTHKEIRGGCLAAGVVFVVAVFLLFRPWAIVPPGHVGVKVFFGSLQDEVFDEGIHPTICEVITVSTQSKSYTVEYDANHANAAVSSDLQTVGFRINVAWYVNGSASARALVRFVDRDPRAWEANIIDPAIMQAVKVVFSGRTLRGLIEQREEARVQVAANISDLMNERLVERDPSLEQALIVTQITLDNLDYSDDFERVIEQTQQEEQRVRLAGNEVDRIRIEAMQQVVEAEAERQAAVERARGEAEASIVRARGEALATILRAEADVQVYMALSGAGLDINTYRFTEVWNGQLPRLLSGDESLGFLVRGGPDASLSPENISIILGRLQESRTSLELNLSEVASREAQLLGEMPEQME